MCQVLLIYECPEKSCKVNLYKYMCFKCKTCSFFEDDYFEGLLACTVVCRAILGFESHDKAGISFVVSP